jgi:Restriction endonuclease
MLHRILARCIATQDVVSLRLRPCSCFLPHSLRGKSNDRALSRGATRSVSSTSAPSHDSLSTFLDYAKRTQLDRASTTFAGTYYEYATQSLLRRYGFSLTRVGGRGDRGVDLKGTWTVATGEEKAKLELPVIMQCKRLKSKVGPNLIRELEGALAGRSNTLGVLVGTKGVTRGVRDAMGRSRVGICWVMLEVEEQAGGEDANEDVEEEVEEKEQGEGFCGVLQAMKDEIVSKSPNLVKDLLEPSEHQPVPPGEGDQDVPRQLGHVRQMLWNRAASAMGLEGVDVVMSYDGTRNQNGDVGKEVMLMWQSRKVHETVAEDRI